jgi:HAE1 family hydrophobic/amphiphilic exporter-1
VASAVLLWLCATVGGAEYTLRDCVRIGLSNSTAIVNARHSQTIAEETVVQARAVVLPHVGLSSYYSRVDRVQEMAAGEGNTIPMGNAENYGIKAELTQLIYSGGKIGAALRAAGLSRSYAEWECREVEATVLRDVRLGFFDVLLAKSAVAVREKSVTQLQSLSTESELKFRHGKASEFEWVSARVKVANEEPLRMEAQNQFELAVAAFQRLLRLDDENASFAGELTCRQVKLDPGLLEKAALEHRPAMAVADTLSRLRDEDVIVASSGGKPSVSGFASYGGMNELQMDTGSEEWTWHWTAGLAAQWSLWDGGFTKGLVREKKVMAMQQRNLADELRRGVRLEVRRAYLDAVRARQTVAATSETIAMGEKALGIADGRYKAGMGTYLEYTDSNLALNTARLMALTALRDHMAALARLQQACGLSDEEFERRTRE